MAEKQGVNKSQAVRGHLDAHPQATNGEIAAALTKQGDFDRHVQLVIDALKPYAGELGIGKKS
jgi:hypothetical protein